LTTGSRGYAQAADDVKLSNFETYIAQTMDTFSNWSDFSESSLLIERALNEGMLDGAALALVPTPWGTFRSPKAFVRKIAGLSREIDKEMTSQLFQNPTVRQRAGSRVAPLARNLFEGRFTVARLKTRTAQEIEAVAFEVDEAVQMINSIKALRSKGVLSLGETPGVLDDLSDVGVEGLEFLERSDLDNLLNARGLAAGGKRASDKAVRGLWAVARRKGISFQELVDRIDDYADELMVRIDNMDLIGPARGSDQRPLAGIEALEDRAKELRKVARYTAKAVDRGESVENLRKAGHDGLADELQLFFADLDRRGYQLVHGKEYMVAHDLMTNPGMFRDFGVSQLNYKTLGNFFDTRAPAIRRLQQENRERAVLSQVLDADPDSQVVRTAWTDLRTILNEIWDPVREQGEQRHMLNWWQKGQHSIASAFTATHVEDLVHHKDLVKQLLRDRGWDQDQIEAIFGAIPKFRETDFANLGLYSLEAKARSKNLNVSALKWAGEQDGYLTPRRLGFVAGGLSGNQLGPTILQPEGEDQSLAARVTGLAAGAAAGAGLGPSVARGAARALTAADKVDGARQGLRAAVKADLRRPEVFDRAINAAEQRPGWMLADRAVRMRDALRFSISPIFDASRYTEGMVLARTGVPLRHADGTRVILPSRLNPKAVKKRLGADEFDAARRQFKVAAVARNHGDVDVADAAVRRFEQVGILGFNTREWQVGAFAELRRMGFSADEAYEAAINTYSYGLKGRSAAELSANFIFFPFSFQKKVVKHAAEFLQDDLGRSIILHDAFKTYEYLDERYDLETFWRDHIPFLNQLKRLNMLAYGVSPGRLGGINSQLFESSFKSAQAAFLPAMTNLRNEDDYAELEKLQRNLLPVWNDINWMLEEAKGLDDLVTVGALPKAQVARAYDEWNVYREEVAENLEARGASWWHLHNDPTMVDMKVRYDRKKLELRTKYPAWGESQLETIQNRQAIEFDKNESLRRAELGEGTRFDFMLWQFESFLQTIRGQMNQAGVGLGPDGWPDAPPWAWRLVRERAYNMAETDIGFMSVWKRFYEPELGILEAKV
jgi:hypothetical protein